MRKYADDTYLLVPASMDNTANSEVAHIVSWAGHCNLKVNMSKCKEIILHRSTTPLVAPPLLISAIPRVTELEALGVVLHDSLSMTPHISKILKRAGQTLYALRVVRAHGLSGNHLHSVTRAHLESRMGYAISAWVGFAKQEDLQRLQKVINKASRWALDGGLSLPSIQDIANNQDKRLFSSILHNQSHVLNPSLPPEKSLSISLRPRAHNRQLIISSTLARKNFLTRMLFNAVY